MSKLTKTASGLLFNDNFEEKTLMWTLSPSNANNVAFEEDGLHMYHNKSYTSYTIVEPALEEYSCIVHLNHVPVNYDDIAGIIVTRTPYDYVECQSFMATGPSELCNSENFKVDVQNMFDTLINDTNYVKWYLNDEEENDTVYTGDTSSIPNRTPGTTINKPEGFIDVLYPYIKFTKMKQKYIFWASTDNKTWIEIGNAIFNDSCQIGFFIYGTEDEDILNNI